MCGGGQTPRHRGPLRRALSREHVEGVPVTSSRRLAPGPPRSALASPRVGAKRLLCRWLADVAADSRKHDANRLRHIAQAKCLVGSSRGGPEAESPSGPRASRGARVSFCALLASPNETVNEITAP